MGVLLKEYKKARADVILGCLADLFAVLYFAETFRFKVREIENSVNATFFPRIVAILVAVCATVILVRALKKLRQIPKENRIIPESERKATRAGLIRIGEVFLVLLLVAVTLKKLGFLLTAPWMMFALFVILESKDKRNYKLYALISVIGPILTFLAFYYGFSTMLPMGILRPYLLQILA